jgi:hypothetical protein
LNTFLLATNNGSASLRFSVCRPDSPVPAMIAEIDPCQRSLAGSVAAAKPDSHSLQDAIAAAVKLRRNILQDSPTVCPAVMAEALRAGSPKILEKKLENLKFLFVRFWTGQEGAENPIFKCRGWVGHVLIPSTG